MILPLIIYIHFDPDTRAQAIADGVLIDVSEMAKACSALLTQLKKKLPWLNEPDATALQTELRHLDDAFKRYFRKDGGYPCFKSRKNPVQSCTSKNNRGTITIQGNRIRLPKLGWVKFAKSRDVGGRILSATIRWNPTDKYFVSVLVKRHPAPAAGGHNFNSFGRLC